jgi:glutaminyl-peptide cyclotransferase
VVHNNQPPKIYTYKITNTYPHDIDGFTQGLEFYNDTLYESTGLNGKSSIRKLDLKTGKILKKTKLSDTYFGEGLTILNDKIYQLTWRSGDGLIYDVNTFERLKIFNYNESKEGWGLCNDGEKLYKSDGTPKIWTLNAETLEEEGYIQPVTNKTSLTKLNELEWVEGKIYANTWQKDGIVIIEPKTGAVEGLIDFRGLRDKVTKHSKLDVLNGIAYNPNTKKLYVTGKNWDKLFEVEIIEK